ncbi:tetratricopeptide repeat protein [Streptomyces coriariae]|uniref:tetratricopeptide repeat protein n=1 Tax=Streptomyces coriariae TaxID=2864460 RepID=UPI001E398B12|nr:tetratricopeptide repeat protein [Streptomyces coriariae]
MTDLSEITAFLKHKIIDVSLPAVDRDGIQALLDSALQLIKREEYQESLEKYHRAYYYALLNTQALSGIRALSDVGNLYIMSGELRFAIALLNRSYALSRAEPIVDPGIRPQIALSLANAHRLTGCPGDALQCFDAAAKDSQYAHNPALLFLAYTGAAEAYHDLQRFKEAVSLLRRASELVSEVPSDDPFKLVYHIERSINSILTESDEQRGFETGGPGKHAAPRPSSDIFARLKEELPAAVIKSLTSAAVCKLWDVQGSLNINLFGVANYNISHSVFRSAVAIGKGAIQNIQGGL